MNIKKIAKAGLLLASVSLLGTGCKRYLDVNTNPNVAQDAGPEFLLPSAQIAIASAVGTELQINGSIWAQHWTQAPSSSQYKIYEQYTPTASNYDRPWQRLYADALEDLDVMERKGAANKQMMYVGVGHLLKAYAFQVLTDGWGDIPYTQALKGEAAQGGIVSPKYDPQALVYDSIINLARSGVSILKGLSSGTTISGDLIYAGDKDNWVKFGNTLLLKMYLRLSERNPAKAQAGIATLPTTSASYIDEESEALINFSSTAGNQNPLYSEMVGLSRTQNLVASSTTIDSMTGMSPFSPVDLRVEVFYTPSGSAGFAGLRQGFYTASPSTPLAIPSPYVGANANNEQSALAPVRLISSYESYLLQAEAAARGWLSANAEDLFYEGVYASFYSYRAAFADLNETLADVGDSSVNGNPITGPITLTADYAYNSYLNGDTLTGNPPSDWAQFPTSGSIQQKVRYIIIQKWFAMTGNQGFEAWTEWRRTGYPEWFRVSANSVIGSINASLPRRLLYPDVEVQRNQNFPGQRSITDRVYWDVH
jgi:hypothetical protein